MEAVGDNEEPRRCNEVAFELPPDELERVESRLSREERGDPAIVGLDLLMRGTSNGSLDFSGTIFESFSSLSRSILFNNALPELRPIVNPLPLLFPSLAVAGGLGGPIIPFENDPPLPLSEEKGARDEEVVGEWLRGRSQFTLLAAEDEARLRVEGVADLIEAEGDREGDGTKEEFEFVGEREGRRDKVCSGLVAPRFGVGLSFLVEFRDSRERAFANELNVGFAMVGEVGFEEAGEEEVEDAMLSWERVRT